MKTRTLVIIITALMTYLLVGMLSSCRTKTVTEYVSFHDTLRISKTDTLVKVRTEHAHDTLRIETEREITVTKEGDTLKVVERRDRWRDRVVHETDTLRETKHDTIYVSMENEHEQVIEKKTSLWEKLSDKIAWFCIILGALYTIYRKYIVPLRQKRK